MKSIKCERIHLLFEFLPQILRHVLFSCSGELIENKMSVQVDWSVPIKTFFCRLSCDPKNCYLFKELEAESALVMEQFWVLLLLLAGL